MATPAVLLLANAMLILSTIQRLRIILDRVRETEQTIAGADVAPETANLSLLNDLLLTHARRTRYVHRALLAFYTSAGAFVSCIIALGVYGLGIEVALSVALGAALLGSVLLLLAVATLLGETWLGIRATDRRFEAVMDLCRELAKRREAT